MCLHKHIAHKYLKTFVGVSAEAPVVNSTFKALGMESGHITHNQIKQTRSHDPGYPAYAARLNGADCLLGEDELQVNLKLKYNSLTILLKCNVVPMQIDLLVQHEISKVRVQGCADENDYVRTFSLQTSDDGETWVPVIDGNGDARVSESLNRSVASLH